ncbi:hypothetical protein B0H19DRAFT_1139936 [Mycena capillaripes]|nr:hypothetical protein B0H19DRAFT_1139936 [Mycena capillaripes]
MQISSLILAFALSFASLVAGQNISSAGIPGSAGVPVVSGTPVASTVWAGTAAPSSWSTATAFPASGYAVTNYGVPSSTIVAASVGGSIAAAVIVLLCALFFLRYRRRKTWVIAVEGANNADLNKRCEALEREVRAMREQLDGIDARRLAGVGGYGVGAVLYTHEKDVEAFKAGADLKDGKERPPTYAD